MKTALEIQKEMMEAVAAGDTPRMLACFSPDVVIREAPGLPFGGDWVGHAGMQGMFAKSAETAVGAGLQTKNELLNVYEVDDTMVITHMMMTITSANGETAEMPILEILRARDGVFVEAMPFYWDTALYNRIIGEG